MSGDGYEVGYKKPPPTHKWRKGGLSPNFKGRPKKLDGTIAQIVERALLEEIQIEENGRKRRVTYFEIILIQLMAKVAEGGSRQAYRVLRKYQRFASSRKMKVVLELKLDGENSYAEWLKKPLVRE
jgi:Family of unknown function (DUF5681)